MDKKLFHSWIVSRGMFVAFASLFVASAPVWSYEADSDKNVFLVQQEDPFANDNNDDSGDPFADDDNNDSSDPFAKGDGEADDPFAKGDGEADDPFAKGDDEADDPFANNSDPGDPFANNSDDDIDPSDIFGNDDGESFVVSPDFAIKGNIGLALSTIFLNHNNGLVDKLDSPEEKFRYLACDVYGNVNAEYKFFSMLVFGSADILATTDFSGVPKFRMDIRELYFSYLNDFVVVRLGHLLIPWSNMNVFTIANYFNPLSSTMYSKQFLQGVNGVQAQFFFAGSMSLEMVLVPLFTNHGVHSTRVNMLLGNSISISSIDMGSILDDLLDGMDDEDLFSEDGLSLRKSYSFDNSAPALSLFNTHVGLRYGVKFCGIDLYVLYFHGFDNRPNYSQTHTELVGDSTDLTKSVKVNIKREYNLIDVLALSGTFNVWQLTFSSDISFTFNDPISYEKTVVLNDDEYTDIVVTTKPTLHIGFGFRWPFLSDWLFIAEFQEFFIFDGTVPADNTSSRGSVFAALVYTLGFEPVDTMFTQAVYLNYRDLQLITLSYIRFDFKMQLYMEIGVGYMNDIESTIDNNKLTEGIFTAFNRSVILVVNVYYEF